MISARVVSLIGLSTGLAALLVGCSEPEPPVVENVVRPVKILTVGGPPGDVTRDFPGTIKGAQNAEMGFEVAGRILEFRVQEGQQVQAGQPLARLDDRDYRAELDKVQANLDKARADLQRSENIYKQDPGAISADKIESDRRAVSVSQASLAQAQKAVEESKASGEINYHDLVADEGVAKVSIVGIGMRSHAGVAAKMFATLRDEGINIKVITTSEIKVSVLIDRKYMELAVQALHDAFGLEKAA